MALGMVIGTFIVMSTTSWPLTWVGLELNLMCFIPLVMKEESNKGPSMMYFITQSIGSLMVLINGLGLESNNFMLPIMTMAIVMKLGAVPVHFWVPSVIPLLTPLGAFVTLSWQKVAPFSMLTSIQLSKWGLSIINVLVGAASMMALSTMISVIMFSGMVQMGWIFSLNEIYFWCYVWLYFFILSPIFIFMHSTSKNFALSLLNAGGLPPFTGFFIKLMAITQLPSWLSVFLLLSSTISLLSYTRMLINTSFSMNKISPFMTIPLFIGILFP